MGSRTTAVALVLALLPGGFCLAQTSTELGIDIELYDPITGSNRACVAPGAELWVHAFVRPGNGALICDLPCGSGIPGGSGNIATAAIDVAFDGTRLRYSQGGSNPDPAYAAVDGLMQEQNVAAGRVGWALTGDWIVDGDPGSGLIDPCSMLKLQSEGWVFRLRFVGVSEGLTAIVLRREADDPSFALSFADICGSTAFTETNGGIDEIKSAAVLVSNECLDVLFFDGFESGDTSAWSAVVP